uniref:Intracellular protein transport protein USO1 n=1 Tax=Heligmosomoides polygyrus TaxID=6339 RepID=A0A8L8JU77_HELPZ
LSPPCACKPRTNAANGPTYVVANSAQSCIEVEIFAFRCFPERERRFYTYTTLGPFRSTVRYNTFVKGSRSQSAKDDETSRKTRQELEERLRLQEEHGASLSKQLSNIQEERAKQKNRFQKVNEALAAFEQNIELGHNKMDTAMNSEIQRRKLHEKSLFSKMTEIEDRLNTYVGNLTNSINQIKSGKENVKIPSLDIDGLRREMEAIAADKSKVSMEGLLKLEEKMARVQTGLVHDRKEITQQISKMSDSDDVDKVKDQLKKLTNVNDEMEKTQDIIRDKVDKQIPKDLNELSSKTDNIRQQLNARLDKEEEERLVRSIKGIETTMLRVTRFTQVRKGARSPELRRRSKIRDRCRMGQVVEN